MKNKGILTIIIILIGLLSFLYYDYSNQKEEKVIEKRAVERTKVEYILDDMTESQALEIGEKHFLSTIKLVANDYLEYLVDDRDRAEKYLINGKNNYIRVLNYKDIYDFLTNKSINIYNKKVNYIEFENKDYIIARKEINQNYVGSIITISDYNDNEIIYNAHNYYCKNYDFEGILIKKPNCYIIDVTDFKFTLIKGNNLLKIKDITEFYDKKIY